MEINSNIFLLILFEFISTLEEMSFVKLFEHFKDDEDRAEILSRSMEYANEQMKINSRR